MATGPDEWGWWWGSWSGRIRCGKCIALMDINAPCLVCGSDYRNLPPTEHMLNGKVITLPPAFAGVLDWSPYVFLQLMHREWNRPLEDDDGFSGLPNESRPARRLLLVLIFWTYFESLMDWFYGTAALQLPDSVARDLLRRYNFIGVRTNRLHQVLFDCTYGQDLDRLGFTSIRQHLELIQLQRNAFMHGNPQSITESLVEQTADMIPEFHEAWIESFNMRCAKRTFND